MQSFFSAESLERVAELLPQGDTLDFTRCVRPNGTAYGTAGKCRKGVERSEEEKTEQDSEDRLFESLVQTLEKRHPDDPSIVAEARKDYKQGQELAEKIRKENVDGSVVVVSNNTAVWLKKRLNDFDDVSLELDHTKNNVYFMANGDLDYGSIEEPKDRLKAALTVRHMFNLLTKSMKPGDLLHCSAFDNDGLGDKREKVYKKIGFVEYGADRLIGEVQEGGGVAPPHSYSEDQESLRNWYVALFGELPR